jgi:O-antigen ligase
VNVIPATSVAPPRFARAGLVALLAALPVALAIAIVPVMNRPVALAAIAGALVLAGVAAFMLRRYGALGLWVALVVVSILAGEMSALPLGGQSGRLLWADGVLAAGLLVALARRGLSLEIPRAPFLDRMVLFIGWSALTLALARDPLTGIAELKEWIVAWAVGGLALAFARDARRARVLLGVVAVTGAMVALLMAWEALHSPFGFVLAVLLKKVDLAWGRTNYLAGLLILALPVTLGLFGHAASWRARVGWIAITVLQSAGILLSASKGAVVALIVGLTIAFARGGKGSRVTAFALVAIAALGIGVFSFGPLHEVIAYRLQSSALDYSVSERMDLYRLAAQQFARHPVFGIGLNNFSVAANRLTGVDTVPHNLELGLLAETGIPGFALGLFWVAALLTAAWRARHRARTPRARALAVGLWAACIGFVVHNQFESTLYGQQYKILLLVVAAATWRLAESSSDESTLER